VRATRWTVTGRGQSAFSGPVVANAAGNNVPGITGNNHELGLRQGPGPGPNRTGGQLGNNDGQPGEDPRDPKTHAWPRRVVPDWSKRGGGADHPHYGTSGFNDKLTVKDRHAYWDTGNQKTGLDFSVGNIGYGTVNDPLTTPPRPDLRLVNRTISYQQGSDHTINQDDLTRPYTWLGEQGSGWAPVYGGVPGLYQPYGTRGGVPFPIVSPVEQGQPGDGPHLVFAGPPHGLHSTTPWKGGAQIISRFASTPQTRPVRQDRPSNSPQAGQSYSQTVLPQGASPVRPRGGQPGRTGTAPASGRSWPGGRGWSGRVYRGGQGSI
jgi:hypothetical protein